MSDDAAKKGKRTGAMIVSLIFLPFVLVCCIGMCAAVAIPQFISYLSQAKIAEAENNLENMFQGASAYYATEQVGPDGSLTTGCAVPPAITDNVPGPHKTVLSDFGESFEAIGFTPADPLYYRYEIESIGGCGHDPRTEVYVFVAHGDLDGDGVQSRFELHAVATPAGTLERSGSIRRENELE